MHACMCLCACIHAFECVHVCVHVGVCACVQVSMCACACLHACMRVMCVWVCVGVKLNLPTGILNVSAIPIISSLYGYGTLLIAFPCKK